MSTTEQQLKDLYSRQLAVEKDQLQQAYAAADAEYADKKKTLQKTTDENLNRTAVEAQRAAVNQAELHNAYGLSSGAAAQARLALENQRAADMAALRQSAQEQDAQLERQRAALAQQYQSEIRRAQQENDIALAEALYQDAKKKQDELDAYTLQKAQLMAEAGNYIPLLNYWKAKGISYTEDDIALLMGGTTGTTGAPSTPSTPTAPSTPPKTAPITVGSPLLTYNNLISDLGAMGISADHKDAPLTKEAYEQTRKKPFAVGNSAVQSSDSYEEYLYNYVAGQGAGFSEKVWAGMRSQSENTAPPAAPSAPAGSTPDAVLENNGYGVTSYPKAVSRLRNMGVSQDVMQGLLTEAEWDRLRGEAEKAAADGEGTINLAVTFDSYIEYLRFYVTAAEKSKNGGTPGYTGHYNTGTGGRYGATGGAS